MKFGAVTCSNYLSWSATRIICRVPAGAKTGKLKVTLSTAAGASSAVSFTVIASPRKLKFRVADAESRDWRHAP